MQPSATQCCVTTGAAPPSNSWTSGSGRLFVVAAVGSRRRRLTADRSRLEVTGTWHRSDASWCRSDEQSPTARVRGHGWRVRFRLRGIMGAISEQLQSGYRGLRKRLGVRVLAVGNAVGADGGV